MSTSSRQSTSIPKITTPVDSVRTSACIAAISNTSGVDDVDFEFELQIHPQAGSLRPAGPATPSTTEVRRPTQWVVTPSVTPELAHIKPRLVDLVRAAGADGISPYELPVRYSCLFRPLEFTISARRPLSRSIERRCTSALPSWPGIPLRWSSGRDTTSLASLLGLTARRGRFRRTEPSLWKTARFSRLKVDRDLRCRDSGLISTAT